MSSGKNPILGGGRDLNSIFQKNHEIGYVLEDIIKAVNNLASNIGVSAVGKLAPPDPVDSIQVQGKMDSATNTVTASSEILHFTLGHNSAVKKGVQYISEIDTNPNFTQPHVLDHGASRSAFIQLPAKDSSGNPQTYYLRSYPQYHGSDPGKRTVLGGLNGATKIQMTGSSSMDLLPSTGSGTANQNGQQGGKGLGTVLQRPAPGPKRNVAL